MSDNSANPVPILIASVLKPVNDTRAYEKLALSLRETNKYHVNIIGFSSKRQSGSDKIQFFSSMTHTQSLWDRLLAQIRFWKSLFKIRPLLVICCTWELLPVAAYLKKRLGFKLLYDVQENYIANLNLNPELTPFKKKLAKFLINKAESVKGIDYFLLAEKCYQDEMPEKTPSIVIENRYSGKPEVQSPIQFERKNGYNFILSGTITPAFGIMDAIIWFSNLLSEFPASKLTVIGHVPISSFYRTLQNTCSDFPEIVLKISNSSVPHQTILHEMRRVDFALLPYLPLPETKSKMPTKLFEAAALGIPVLINPNPQWMGFLDQFKGGTQIDFLKPERAVKQFKSALDQIYFIHTPPQNIQWESQEIDFLNLISNILY